ncbi:Uncharacterized protein FWK35_00016002 [Aphis craccivora]|uniref:Uncharacterized protein n=1 Tax=Aphis craccivora TaxID=307492 RepID=A0A6G0ZKD9_APHCR|nr:Uncharacterized protein FWK35_00016002 [Aphis craccivora]
MSFYSQNTMKDFWKSIMCHKPKFHFERQYTIFQFGQATTHVRVYKNVRHESAGAKKWSDYTHQNSTEAYILGRVVCRVFYCVWGRKCPFCHIAVGKYETHKNKNTTSVLYLIIILEKHILLMISDKNILIILLIDNIYCKQLNKFTQRKVGKRIEKEEIKRTRKTFVIKLDLQKLIGQEPQNN